ncbi:MAG TPA: energy transducer TonB [Bryobacteraceae bacterium]|nr:energy transducer TonB [Bryobacteraceae bacterium]
MPVLFLMVIAALAACAQTNDKSAKDWITEGVRLFKGAQYAGAAEAFQKAVQLDPSSKTAHLYLGTAYLSSYIPGAGTPENQEAGRRAEREFQAVLSIDPNDRAALESLASLNYNQATSEADPQVKNRKLDEAASLYERLLVIEPNHKSAHHSLGVLEWMKIYPEIQRARQAAGMRLEDPGPLRVPQVRSALAAKHLPALEQAHRHLLKALEIDPTYDDAMAYLNLIVRLRADLTETPEAYAREIDVANQWVQKAIDQKHSKQQRQQSSALGAAMASPPPPAPPPPPGSQAAIPAQIRVGANVQASKFVHFVDPEYPPLAAQARIQGTVRFDVVVGPDGRIYHLKLVSGHPLLVPAATIAVQQYRYQPTLLNGHPVAVETVVDVPFVLAK